MLATGGQTRWRGPRRRTRDGAHVLDTAASSSQVSLTTATAFCPAAYARVEGKGILGRMNGNKDPSVWWFQDRGVGDGDVGAHVGAFEVVKRIDGHEKYTDSREVAHTSEQGPNPHRGLRRQGR